MSLLPFEPGEVGEAVVDVEGPVEEGVPVPLVAAEVGVRLRW